MGTRTLSAGIGLHELVLRARIVELGGQPGELGEDLVDDADLGGELVLVDVEGQEASDIPQAPDDQNGGLFRHGELRICRGSWLKQHKSLQEGRKRCGVVDLRGDFLLGKGVLGRARKGPRSCDTPQSRPVRFIETAMR